jgi:hypothetical protein
VHANWVAAFATRSEYERGRTQTVTEASRFGDEMSLDVAVFSGRKVRLADGWWKQTLITIFGGADVDGSAAPGDGARLTIVAVLGGVRVIVPAGARLKVGGFAFLGGRKVDVHSNPDGPKIRVRAFSVLGGINVSEAQRASVGTSAGT